MAVLVNEEDGNVPYLSHTVDGRELDTPVEVRGEKNLEAGDICCPFQSYFLESEVTLAHLDPFGYLEGKKGITEPQVSKDKKLCTKIKKSAEK